MPLPAGETVERLRAPLVTDPYSGEASKPDWAHPQSITFAAGVADSGSVEVAQAGRDSVDSDYTLYADAGVDVLATDRLVVRGLTCEVAGRPFDWVSPFSGRSAGRVIRAKVREG